MFHCPICNKKYYRRSDAMDCADEDTKRLTNTNEYGKREKGTGCPGIKRNKCDVQTNQV